MKNGRLVTRKVAAQRRGLKRMVRASERAGLYNKELEGLLPFVATTIAKRKAKKN